MNRFKTGLGTIHAQLSAHLFILQNGRRTGKKMKKHYGTVVKFEGNHLYGYVRDEANDDLVRFSIALLPYNSDVVLGSRLEYDIIDEGKDTEICTSNGEHIASNLRVVEERDTKMKFNIGGKVFSIRDILEFGICSGEQALRNINVPMAEYLERGHDLDDVSYLYVITPNGEYRYFPEGSL